MRIAHTDNAPQPQPIPNRLGFSYALHYPKFSVFLHLINLLQGPSGIIINH